MQGPPRSYGASAAGRMRQRDAPLGHGRDDTPPVNPDHARHADRVWARPVRPHAARPLPAAAPQIQILASDAIWQATRLLRSLSRGQQPMARRPRWPMASP